MATYNGNNAYLEIDGTDVSGYWTGEVGLDGTNEGVDITAGAGRKGRQRAPGLNDNSITFGVVYDDETLGTYVQRLKRDVVHNVVYGPEGNAPGKPKFQGAMLLNGVSGPKVGIEKPKAMFELSFQQADEPTSTIEDGGVF